MDALRKTAPPGAPEGRPASVKKVALIIDNNLLAKLNSINYIRRRIARYFYFIFRPSKVD